VIASRRAKSSSLEAAAWSGAYRPKKRQDALAPGCSVIAGD
jgi:hypothetical protein